MAVTIANVRRSRAGNIRKVYVDITGPASYGAGGELLTVAQLQALAPEVWAGLPAVPANLNAIIHFNAETPITGQAVVLNRATLKIMYFNGTTEIAGAVNLSAVVTRVEISYQAVTGA